MDVIDDRYELLDVVGSGGMATVWRARDRKLDRFVAVKRPHPAPDGDPVVDRFRREAQTAATVNHPHLVTVYDVGADASGPFLVMELVDAPSLAQRVVGAADARRLGAEIAAGLAALHAAGIVHRDVKPANILLGSEGAKLSDFGIARSIDETAALTVEGATYTTPAYAAPEVLAGGVFTEASDVYALGLVLRELVLGRRPTSATDTQVLITDPFWRRILEHTLSDEPSSRPTARELVGFLLDEESPGADVSTVPLDTAGRAGAAAARHAGVARPGPDDRVVTTVHPLADAERTPLESSRRRLLALFAVAGVVCVLLLGVAIVSGSGDGAGGSVADPVTAFATTGPATTTATTVTEAASAPPPTSGAPGETAAPTTATPTTVDPAVVDAMTQIDDARRSFVEFFDEIRGESIDDREADRIVEDVENGVRAVAEGDLKAVEKEFGEAVRRIGRRIDDESDRTQALEVLSDLLDVLGVDAIEAV